MDINRFNEIVNARLDKIRATLLKKRGEYANDEDVLANFCNAAEMDRTTMQEVCRGYMLKHWQSIRNLLSRESVPCLALIDEKIGDAVNYLILLEAILLDGGR